MLFRVSFLTVVSFRQIKTIVVYSVYVVGMHHYGSRQLEIGDGYTVLHETSNDKDVNALSVNKNNHIVGYVKKEQSRVLAKLFNDSLVNSRVFMKPKFEPIIRNRRKGPEQRCNMGLRCLDENVNKVRDHLSGHFVLKVV